MGSAFKLPVVYLCENNQYAMSTSVKYSVAIDDISERSKAYGIPGVTINGNKVLEVYEAVSLAIERAREGKGPTLIEAKTYRWKGHSKSDKNVYRTKEEIKVGKLVVLFNLFASILSTMKVLKKIF